MKFLDLAKIFIRSGNGGNGAVSFRREKYVEFGGPDGGDGGKGGSIFFEGESDLNTLIDFRYQRHFFAQNGQNGMGKQRTGAKGSDIIIKVPLGTEILDSESETIVGDIVSLADRIVLAEGGNGGWGNSRFKSSTNRAPQRFNYGKEGTEKTIWLRLKLIADIGICGLPNAGKSTFLSLNSNAKPKIADYPFTTLYPNLGVVEIDGNEMVFADIPGVIKGAHLGRGVGIRFLGHVERCSTLIHLVDGTSDNIVDDYSTVVNELKCYGGCLLKKRRIVVINKIDALDKKTLNKRKTELLRFVDEIYLISSKTGEGVKDLLRILSALLESKKVKKSLTYK